MSTKSISEYLNAQGDWGPGWTSPRPCRGWLSVPHPWAKQWCQTNYLCEVQPGLYSPVHTRDEFLLSRFLESKERSTNTSPPFQPVVSPAQGVISLRSCLCGLCSFLPATFPLHFPTERWWPSCPTGISDPWVFSFGLVGPVWRNEILDCCFGA